MLTISLGLGRGMSGRLGLILQAGTMSTWSRPLASRTPVNQLRKRLLDNYLYVKAERHHLLPGLITGPGGVQMDPAKVSAVAVWPIAARRFSSSLGLLTFTGFKCQVHWHWTQLGGESGQSAGA